uniref:lanthionine synthetase C family protein n=1 Tax=Microbispora cellulosiformans TaxID=2614688 RepID=UPI001CDA1CA7|nr:lanthionine synthetase C family protein [Microbispora cellulosiformans]
MIGTDHEVLAVAEAVADALSDPRNAWTTASPPGGRAWPQSLAGGAAGIALLHIERARAGLADWSTAHAWLSVAASGELTAAANAGLFFGAPALAFVMHTAADSSSRYRRGLTTLDEAVIAITRTRLAAAHARIDRGDQPVMKEFDLIRGLTGLGIYHLRRHSDHRITHDVLSYLVRLTEPLPSGTGLPPWWTNVAPNGEPNPEYPQGHANFGLSHGVGSVLALLSLAVLRNVPVAGMTDAIERICEWTDLWRQQDDAGPWWPGFITMDQVREQHVSPSLRPRPSWCYGVAGTARAQQLAGMALGDTARQQTAEDAMLAALRDPAQFDLLPEIGLCHGKAGLLQAAWRMAADARTPRIAAELPHQANQLAAQLARSVPDPELLDGTAGAVLALHTVGSNAVASDWDAFLSLA